MDINGSSVMLTGASGGLGSAIARDLARRGASLVLTARRAEVLDALAAETGGEVLVADLANRTSVERVAARAATCDVLIANAGVGTDPPLTEMTEADIDQALEVNLRSPMVLAHLFAKAKIAADKPGRILLIGSLASIAASPGTRLYNATKFGLRGFSLAMSQDLEGTGVTCTLVAPGFISEAGMFADNGMELPPGVRTRRPDDVALVVAKAIEKGPVEVFVAPPEMTFMSKVASVAPGISATVQRKLGVSERIAERDR